MKRAMIILLHHHPSLRLLGHLFPLQGCLLSLHQQKQEMITAHWLQLLPTPCGSVKWYSPASESACCYGNTSTLTAHIPPCIPA